MDILQKVSRGDRSRSPLYAIRARLIRPNSPDHDLSDRFLEAMMIETLVSALTRIEIAKRNHEHTLRLYPHHPAASYGKAFTEGQIAAFHYLAESLALSWLEIQTDVEIAVAQYPLP